MSGWTPGRTVGWRLADLAVSVTVRRWSRIQDPRYRHIISDNCTDSDGEGRVGGGAAGDGAPLPPRLGPAPAPPRLPAGAWPAPGCPPRCQPGTSGDSGTQLHALLYTYVRTLSVQVGAQLALYQAAAPLPLETVSTWVRVVLAGLCGAFTVESLLLVVGIKKRVGQMVTNQSLWLVESNEWIDIDLSTFYFFHLKKKKYLLPWICHLSLEFAVFCGLLTLVCISLFYMATVPGRYLPSYLVT